MKKKIVSLLFAAALIISAAPLASSADTAFTEYKDFYGRAALSALPNGDALVYAYDRITEAVEDHASYVQVYDGVHPISVDELKVVRDAYRRDHVEHFWIGNSNSFSISASTVSSMTVDYIMDKAAAGAAKGELEEAIDKILAGLDPEMSDYEIELYLHDAICSSVEYRSGDNCRNAYGALVEHAAVCEGYAEAMQLLLYRAGIPAFTAIGSSINPTTGQSEGHEWLYAMIGGKWYHVDPTWDDQGYVFHQYFNLSDAAVTADHTMEATAYALPSCTSDDAFYYKVSASETTEYDVDSVAAMMKAGGLSAVVYMSSGIETFLGWFFDNAGAIAREAGLSGTFGCSYLTTDKEARIFFTVDPTGVSLPASLSLSVGERAALTPTFAPEYATERDVTWSSSEEGVATVDEKGKITAVGEGTASITVTTVTGGFSAVCTLTVSAPAQPVRGDTDGDGFLTARDVILIMRYLVGYTAEDEPSLASFDPAIADFDSNGRLNNRDVLGIMLAIINNG